MQKATLDLTKSNYIGFNKKWITNAHLAVRRAYVKPLFPFKSIKKLRKLYRKNSSVCWRIEYPNNFDKFTHIKSIKKLTNSSVFPAKLTKKRIVKEYFGKCHIFEYAGTHCIIAPTYAKFIKQLVKNNNAEIYANASGVILIKVDYKVIAVIMPIVQKGKHK